MNIFDKEIFIISCYANTEYKENLLLKCIKQLKSIGKDVLIASHYPVQDYIVKHANYYIYDSDNIIDTTRDLTNTTADYFIENDGFKLESCMLAHSSALSRIFNISLNFIKNIGYEYFTVIESDSEYDLDDLKKFNNIKSRLISQNKKLFFFKLRPFEFSYWENHGIFNIYESYCFGGLVDEFNSKLIFPKTLTEWKSLQEKDNNNFTLEYILTNAFIPHKDNYVILDSIRHEFPNSKINVITVGDPTGIYFNNNTPLKPILLLSNNQHKPRIYKIRASQWGIAPEHIINSGAWWFDFIDITQYNQDISITVYEDGNIIFRNFYVVSKEFLQTIKNQRRITFK